MHVPMYVIHFEEPKEEPDAEAGDMAERDGIEDHAITFVCLYL